MATNRKRESQKRAQAEKNLAKENANKKQLNDAKRSEQLKGIEELKKRKATRT